MKKEIMNDDLVEDKGHWLIIEPFVFIFPTLTGSHFFDFLFAVDFFLNILLFTTQSHNDMDRCL